MHFHTHWQDEASDSSNPQDRVSPSTPNINPSRVGDSGDPLSDARDRLAHLTFSRMQRNNACGPVSDRAQAFKALPSYKVVKDIGLKSIERWGKSFEQTEQEHLFQDLEPVEALKKKTNSEVIQNHFETVVKFSAGIKSCVEDFQELRKPFDDLASAKHMTVAEQVEAVIKLYQELKENMTKFFKNSDFILQCNNDLWKFQIGSVKETKEKIDSILSKGHDRLEDVQFTLDMLKDGERMVPKIKEPSGLATTFLEGAVKYGFLKLAKRYKDKWLGSKMAQDVYQEEKSKTDALNQKLDESKGSLRNVHITWAALRAPIYLDMFVVIKKNIRNGNVSFTAITNKLDETEVKLLTLVELIEGFLAQITQEYGVEFGTREVKRVCSRLPNIFIALEMLLSGKEVIADDHKHTYEEHIYEICKATLEHFNIMRDVHWECGIAIDVDRQEAFLRDDLPRFQNSVTPHLQGIIDIAEVHVSKSKSKEAEKKRAKDDRYHGDSVLARPGRPLVTADEILWALYKVIDALLLIQAVSSASTVSDEHADENANCTEEPAANDSLAWLKMPEEMSIQFYAVLFDEAKKLEVLKDRAEREANARSNEESESEGPFASLRRLMARKPR